MFVLLALRIPLQNPGPAPAVKMTSFNLGQIHGNGGCGAEPRAFTLEKQHLREERGAFTLALAHRLSSEYSFHMEILAK